MSATIKCPHCGQTVESGNFCEQCGQKMVSKCACWVKKQPYDCGHEQCPGIKLIVDERSGI